MAFKILITSLIMSFVSVSAFAWNTNCTNGSCEASNGRLKVFWAAQDMGDSMYLGELTGVEGLPITMENFATTSKKIDEMFEKYIPAKQSMTNNEKGAPGKKMIFTKKEQSNNLAAGNKVSIDYTLAFIKWLGDTRFSSRQFNKTGDIGRYCEAAEYALNAYMNGTIHGDVESFFFEKEAANVDRVSVDATLDENNKDMVLTKYIGLTRVYKDDHQKRYADAHQEVMRLLYSQDKASIEELKKVNEDYQTQMEGLQILIKPNQTALKLYNKNKDLAFAKWIGDAIISSQTYPSPKDRYTIALDAVAKYSNTEELKKNRTDFEKDIQNKDERVQIITFKGPKLPPMLMGGLALPVFGFGGYWYWRKRRNKSRGDTMQL